MEKVLEFKEKKVPVGFAIIDDMWADVPPLNDVPADIEFSAMVKVMHASKLRSFRGDSKRFPKGMRAAIEDIKHAGIPYVGVWFPTTDFCKEDITSTTGICGGRTTSKRKRTAFAVRSTARSYPQHATVILPV